MTKNISKAMPLFIVETIVKDTNKKEMFYFTTIDEAIKKFTELDRLGNQTAMFNTK